MGNLKNDEKVLEILNRISGKKMTSINMDGAIKDELSLDSIQIVELFISLEKEFEIELPLQMMTVRTCKEFTELLEIQLNNRVLSPS